MASFGKRLALAGLAMAHAWAPPASASPRERARRSRSLSPAMLRVAPSSASASLLVNKVESKLAGTQPACGSAMPSPATASPLTQALVDLIKQWIEAGAHND
jgi:hypothetical protein